MTHSDVVELGERGGNAVRPDIFLGTPFPQMMPGQGDGDTVAFPHISLKIGPPVANLFLVVKIIPFPIGSAV